MSESIRSFLAFDIENELVTNRLAAAQSLLVQTGADLKIVEPKNIHMTIRFLGDVPPRLVEKIFEIMKNIKFSAF
jgi:2'-5' RNA ligase